MEKKIKILAADDEKNILDLLSDSLESAGYQVVLASDGEEALDKALKEKPDIILLDVNMPKMRGFDVCRSIRKDKTIGSTPIIIVSALGDEYNKINGFNEGADDYVTKPVNLKELNARIETLLYRAHGLKPKVKKGKKEEEVTIERIPSGSKALDKILGGGLPKGSNILLVGKVGEGKSDFCRQFIATGLKENDNSIFIAVDDDPKLIRNSISSLLPSKAEEFEKLGTLRFVDAFSWSTGETRGEEKYSVTGTLDLTQLSGLISDASSELGQSIQQKAGGRRVIDSISSFLVNFELSNVQKFLSQIARTAIAFGGVTTLYVIEAGALSDKDLNNIKYIMDGVIEFKEEDEKFKLRVANMKWCKCPKDWVDW